MIQSYLLALCSHTISGGAQGTIWGAEIQPRSVTCKARSLPDVQLSNSQIIKYVGQFIRITDIFWRRDVSDKKETNRKNSS